MMIRTLYGKVLNVSRIAVSKYRVEIDCVLPTATVILDTILAYSSDRYTRICLSLIDQNFMTAPASVWKHTKLGLILEPYNSFSIVVDGANCTGVELVWTESPMTPDGPVDEMRVFIPIARIEDV